MIGDSRVVADGFGRNVIRIRHRAGLSQEEVGERAGLHRTEIGMLERGIRLPRIDTVIKVASALEVDVAELFEGLSWRPGTYRVGSFSIGGRPQGESGSSSLEGGA